MSAHSTQFTEGASLILGGARSGKSGFAEAVADASGRRKIYLATSEIRDDEMAERISHHRARRGPEWELVEEPIEIAGIIKQRAGSATCILVDCLTLWLTNLMMAERDIDAESAALVDVLAQLPQDCSVLLVSNEVGQGIVPMEKMARDFRDHAGRLHQDIAATVPNVWFITAGLPQKLK
ncbi:MAG: bifunctional adenosylcobinamide kinase/adenosylcobinamide-phosphate guanylyltransferase [Rhizobiaceae bacterium]